jgi:hypothetical protein
MKQTSKGISLLLALAWLLVSCGGREPAQPQILKVGEQVSLEQKLTVNVVFVGLEEGSPETAINLSTFQAELPKTYRTISRIPSFYNGPQFTGNDFNFEYKTTFADQAFEDKFFAYLTSQLNKSKPAEEQVDTSITLGQLAYNCQYFPTFDPEEDPTTPDDGVAPCMEPSPNVSRPVTENYWIDAASTEKWLVDNAPSLGVDPKQYTVFYINWYGRPDFKFHVYTKTDEAETDTGLNFGLEFDSTKMIAWGGSPEEKLGTLGRVWFVDLSAGPELNTSNWFISKFDPLGPEDDPLPVYPGYTIPPIWEYGSAKATYRTFNTLSLDLAKLTRYVAINLLFTPSPLYRVSITPPDLPSAIELDVNLYEGDPATTGANFIKGDVLSAELAKLQPENSFTTEVTATPLPTEAGAAYDCLTQIFTLGVPCNPSSIIGNTGGDLFLYSVNQLGNVLEGEGDYEVPIFAYNLSSERNFGLLGVAEDDYTTGTQSVIQTFTALDFGYGFTDTTIHEVGHHVGLSHPHDGFDYERRTDYGPDGAYAFAWLGDESHSVMSYLGITRQFGQFNRDSMNRYLVAAYLNQAVTLLERTEAAGKIDSLGKAITDADKKASDVLTAYQAMNYGQAVKTAKEVYTAIFNAARDAGIDIKGDVWSETFKPYLMAPKTVTSGITVLEPSIPINDGFGMLEKKTNYITSQEVRR